MTNDSNHDLLLTTILLFIAVSCIFGIYFLDTYTYDKKYKTTQESLNESINYFKYADDLKEFQYNIRIENDSSIIETGYKYIIYSGKYSGFGMADVYIIENNKIYRYTYGKENNKIDLNIHGEIGYVGDYQKEKLENYNYEIYIFVCNTKGEKYMKHFKILDELKFEPEKSYSNTIEYCKSIGGCKPWLD